MVSRAVLVLESISTVQDGDSEEHSIYPHYPYMKPSPKQPCQNISIVCDKCIKVCVCVCVVQLFGYFVTNGVTIK